RLPPPPPSSPGNRELPGFFVATPPDFAVFTLAATRLLAARCYVCRTYGDICSVVPGTTSSTVAFVAVGATKVTRAHFTRTICCVCRSRCDQCNSDPAGQPPLLHSSQ